MLQRGGQPDGGVGRQDTGRGQEDAGPEEVQALTIQTDALQEHSREQGPQGEDADAICLRADDHQH